MKSKLKKSVICGILPLPDKNIYAGVSLILFLLLLPFFIQAAGQAEWEGQVNNAFRQARQSSAGLKGKDRATANHYIDQAESAWNKLKTKPYWYLQQQFQQQNQMNKNFMQQQNRDLFMQQRFLQNQANFKNPVLQTINPFGDYLFHGVSIRPEDGRLHGPGTIADTPAQSKLFINASQENNSIGMKALDEMRHLGNINSPPLNLPAGTAASQATTIKNTGLWDNPMAEDDNKATAAKSVDAYANNPNVVDLRDATSLTPKLFPDNATKQAGSPITEFNPYSTMSDERLNKKAEALKDALRKTGELSTDNIRGYSELEADAVAGKEKAWQAFQDSATTFAMGTTQYVSENNNLRKLFTAVNTEPGPEKIDAMRQAAQAAKLNKDVENAGKATDAAALIDSANSENLKDAAGQGAMMIGGALIKAPSRFSPTPLAAIPGVVKLGIDTTLVWTDYYVLYKESQRQEQLTRQLDANRLKLSKQLNEIVEEQKRRNAKKP